MFPPCVLMVEKFLPAIRILVARELKSKGLSQLRIAHLLGVTQAAVNGYVRKDPEKAFRALSDFGLSGEEAKNLAALLANLTLVSPVESTFALYQFWTKLLVKGKVCDEHISRFNQLVACDVCLGKRRFEHIADSEEVEVLTNLKQATKLLEASSIFSSLIPEVFTNIVMAKSDARTPSDVAGIPGRIARLKNGIRVGGDPEFGASRHMASVLLAALQVDNTKRACLNIKYDKDVEAALNSLGYTFYKTSSNVKLISTNDDQVLARIKDILAEKGFVPDVIIDEGGVGIEPMAYIFDLDAVGAARKALEIAKVYKRLLLP